MPFDWKYFDELELDLEVIAYLVDRGRFSRDDLEYLESSFLPGLEPELEPEVKYSSAAKT